MARSPSRRLIPPGVAAQASEIDAIENKLAAIERLGYVSEGHFVLAKNTRATDYHDPMETLLAEKSKEWAGIPQGLEVIEEARHEIAIYRKFSDYIMATRFSS